MKKIIVLPVYGIKRNKKKISFKLLLSVFKNSNFKSPQNLPSLTTAPPKQESNKVLFRNNDTEHGHISTSQLLMFSPNQCLCIRAKTTQLTVLPILHRDSWNKKLCHKSPSITDINSLTAPYKNGNGLQLIHCNDFTELNI